ncbi:hypothetical protein ACE5IS_14445 [Leptospira wolffii]|uniref:Lipoprotein n=1 Tax=Leptospira wolffii TaxID=409998 RepID=A0ABV5BQN5_9LEPT|nr:hypothetical protein [Leptospira wolffii]
MLIYLYGIILPFSKTFYALFFSKRSFRILTSAALLFLVFAHILLCSGPQDRTFSSARETEIPPNLEKGKVFLAGHQADHTKNTQEILSLLKRLVDGTVKKDFRFLPEIVSVKEGIYLDLKGHWSREDLIRELATENNYFQTYFFDRELLQKQKNSSEVRTVRDLLLQSGGIVADLYFESSSACEVKLRFKENSKLEKELINPYFVKSEGKWYLYRLF